MNPNAIPLFQMIRAKMGWLTQRQRILAQNVANADTPDYRPKDLKKVDFLKRVKGEQSFRITLAQTDSAHLPLRGERGRFEVNRKPGAYETAPSGNAVVLEEQLIKVAQTSADYELMTSLYRKHIGMFRIALGRTQQ